MGLYYYGARYLDAKYSRWLSTDPAVGEYVPLAPVSDEARKHNEKLPGQGGIFNVVNFQLYHYAGNNPVKYTDPDGRASLDELRALAKSFRAEGKAGDKNLYLRPVNLRRDCCFARASIIADVLRRKGYKVNYAFANHPKRPNSESRFSYHIAACVEIDGENYVVDPLYNLECPYSGLSKFDQWVNFQDADNGDKRFQDSGIMPGYDKDGKPKENMFIKGFYDAYNQNNDLSIPEYAEKLMNYFKETGEITGYDGN